MCQQPADSLIAASIKAEADSLLRNGKSKEALVAFKKSSKLFEKAGYVENSIKSLNSAVNLMLGMNLREEYKATNAKIHAQLKAHNLQHLSIHAAALYNDAVFNYFTANFEEAIKLFNQSAAVAEKAPDSEPQYVILAKGMVGSCYYQLGEYGLAATYMNTALEQNKEQMGKDHPYVATSSMNVGAVHFERGDYEKALEFFLEAERIIRAQGTISEPALLENILQNIGATYGYMGEYPLSLSYMVRAIDLKKETQGENHPDFAVLWGNYGSILLLAGDTAEAHMYFDKSIEAATREYGPTFPQVGSSIGNKGELFFQQGNFPAARKALARAIEINKLNENYPYPTNHKYYLKLAELESDAGNKEAALDYIDLCMEIARISFENRGREAAKIYLSAARIYGKFHMEETFPLLEKARACVSQIDLRESSAPGSLDLSKVMDLSTLVDAARVRMNFYLAPGFPAKTSNAKKAFEEVLNASYIIDSIRKRHISRESREELGKMSADLFEGGIQAGLAIYHEDPAYKEGIFSLVEKGKGNLLQAALNDTRARKFAGVPDSLQERERAFRLDLAQFQNQLLKLPEGKKEEERKAIHGKILATRAEMVKLSDFVRQEYPKYFDLKFDASAPNPASLMQWCQERDAAIIEFYAGDSVGAIFYFTPNEWGIEKLEDYDTRLADTKLLTGVLRNGPQGTSRKADWEAFSAPARSLYKAIFDKWEDRLANYANWVIIPDGAFCNIPFEVLLTSDESNNNSFKNAPYLTHKRNIRYSYSAKALFPISEEKAKNGEMLALAPSFQEGNVSENRSGLSALPFAKREVEAILTHLNGTPMTGNEASETFFKDKANQYGILHLATHGIMDDKRPMFSRIMLSGDSLNDGDLHAYELFEQDLNASLAVLSACNTGTGVFRRGEGVMSMARGFAYAGCPSVVMSLWQVEDRATSLLMEEFYAGLASGLPKDEALRKAKIAYLSQSQEMQAHPFFWAGFVQIGDASPLSEGSANTIWWVLGILAIGVGGLLYFNEAS